MSSLQGCYLLAESLLAAEGLWYGLPEAPAFGPYGAPRVRERFETFSDIYSFKASLLAGNSGVLAGDLGLRKYN